MNTTKNILTMFIAMFMINLGFANESNVTTNNKTTKNNKRGLITINTDNCGIGSACDLVVSTSNAVITTVNKGLTTKKTHDIIENIVIPNFDFRLMTMLAMGSNWKQASNNEQLQVVDLFQNLLIYTYSSALSKFKDADVTINNVNYIAQNRVAVMSQVILPNSQSTQPINVEYDLISNKASSSNDQKWKVYDIKIETVSLVTTYRNQFNEIIQSNKIDGLINQLKEKVTNLKAKNNG